MNPNGYYKYCSTLAGGGVAVEDLAKATATINDVLNGKTFYSGNNVLKTGNLNPIEKYEVILGTTDYTIQEKTIPFSRKYITVVVYRYRMSLSGSYDYHFKVFQNSTVALETANNDFQVSLSSSSATIRAPGYRYCYATLVTFSL